MGRVVIDKMMNSCFLAQPRVKRRNWLRLQHERSKLDTKQDFENEHYWMRNLPRILFLHLLIKWCCFVLDRFVCSPQFISLTLILIAHCKVIIPKRVSRYLRPRLPSKRLLGVRLSAFPCSIARASWLYPSLRPSLPFPSPHDGLNLPTQSRFNQVISLSKIFQEVPIRDLLSVIWHLTYPISSPVTRQVSSILR